MRVLQKKELWSSEDLWFGCVCDFKWVTEGSFNLSKRNLLSLVLNILSFLRCFCLTLWSEAMSTVAYALTGGAMIGPKLSPDLACRMLIGICGQSLSTHEADFCDHR